MMPASARIDALHVATSRTGWRYNIYWTQNCKHIANAHELPRVYRLLDELGLSGVLICTPVEFLEATTVARNEILDELHAARRKILDDYNGDTAAYLRDAQARLEASGRPVWRGKQRTIRCSGAAKSGELPVENSSSPPAER